MLKRSPANRLLVRETPHGAFEWTSCKILTENSGGARHRIFCSSSYRLELHLGTAKANAGPVIHSVSGSAWRCCVYNLLVMPPALFVSGFTSVAANALNKTCTSNWINRSGYFKSGRNIRVKQQDISLSSSVLITLFLHAFFLQVFTAKQHNLKLKTHWQTCLIILDKIMWKRGRADKGWASISNLE